jgi:hypothetical protein
MKNIKLFEQFIKEAVTFDKFIDPSKILGDPQGKLKRNYQNSFTLKDRDGESVIGEEGVYIDSDLIEIYLSDEGSYQIGEIISASLDLSPLKGLSLDLTKAEMGADFKNLKVDNGILKFDYTIPSDFQTKLKKEWGTGNSRGIEKYLETLKGGIEKVISTISGKTVPPFSVIIPSSSIEDSASLTINLLFDRNTQVSK